VIDGQGNSHVWAGHRPEVEGDLTGGATPSAKGGGAAAYRFGASPDWVMGWIRGWAGFGPAAFYSPFLFLSFSFSVFYFFDKFCKKAPNQFKPISKFSKNQHNVLKQ
jgi:hypothetical protein